jgi:hypothetical protein
MQTRLQAREELHSLEASEAEVPLEKGVGVERRDRARPSRLAQENHELFEHVRFQARRIETFVPQAFLQSLHRRG